MLAQNILGAYWQRKYAYSFVACSPAESTPPTEGNQTDPTPSDPTAPALLAEDKVTAFSSLMGYFSKVYNTYGGNSDAAETVDSTRLATDIGGLQKEDFYVAVNGTFTDVDTVKLGNAEYKENDKFSVSIGDNAFYSDTMFYVDNGTLYLNMPVLYIYLISNDTVSINGENYLCDSFKKTTTALTLSNFMLTDDNYNDKNNLTLGENNVLDVTYTKTVAGYRYSVRYEYKDIADGDLLFLERSTTYKGNTTYSTAIDIIKDLEGDEYGPLVIDYPMFGASYDNPLVNYSGREMYRKVTVFSSSGELKGVYELTLDITCQDPSNT